MWDSQLKLDVLRNSNMFTGSLLHQWIDRYVGNKNHLNSNELRATDGERKSILDISNAQRS